MPEIQVYRENVKSFEGVAEFSAMRMTAQGLDRPRQMHVGIVTGNYEVSPRDPTVFISLPLVLPAIAVLSSYLPARRATRLAPAEALREE